MFTRVPFRSHFFFFHQLFLNRRPNQRSFSDYLGEERRDDDPPEYRHSELRGIANTQIKKRKKLFEERRTSKKAWESGYRFVDKIRLRVSGGTGGKGSLASESLLRRVRLKPTGGHGGAGGSVILVAHEDEQSLRMKHHAKAENGGHGGGKKQFGRSGNNLLLRVPCGVVVKRILTMNEEWDEENKRIAGEKMYEQDDLRLKDGDFWWSDENSNFVDEPDYDDEDEIDEAEFFKNSEDEGNLQNFQGDLSDEGGEEHTVVTVADLDKHGAYVVVARGGRGGIGSMRYGSSNGPIPPDHILSRDAQPEEGEVAHLELELKLIADVGLVGFPNAGKSSLLRAMSRATPKIAPYPFTTLHPLLGIVEYRDGSRVRMADIPGIIGGASEGRGCGHQFLRHIERTKALMYVVDIAGTDDRDPVEDLKVLVNELSLYGDGDLLERRAIVMANKIDLLEKERVADILASLSKVADELGINRAHDVHAVSAGVTGDGLGLLSKSIRETVTSVELDRATMMESLWE